MISVKKAKSRESWHVWNTSEVSDFQYYKKHFFASSEWFLNLIIYFSQQLEENTLFLGAATLHVLSKVMQVETESVLARAVLKSSHVKTGILEKQDLSVS